jgi:streptogramin lyase
MRLKKNMPCPKKLRCTAYGIALLPMLLTVSRAQHSQERETEAANIGAARPALDAILLDPEGIAVDGEGDLYIVDRNGNQVRKVDGKTGLITTIAGTGERGFRGDGGPATEAALGLPKGVAVDSAGNVYIADTANNRIRKVDAQTGVILTVAGNGENSAVNMFDLEGTQRKDPVTGAMCSTVGTGKEAANGDTGPAKKAQLNEPASVAVDSHGDLYVADRSNGVVRKVNVKTGVIDRVAGAYSNDFGGDGCLARSAQLNLPQDVAVDGKGNLYIADTFNHRLRKVDAVSGRISTLADDDADGTDHVALDSAGNVYVASETYRIRRIDANTQAVTIIAGTGKEGFSGDQGPAVKAEIGLLVNLVVDESGNLYLTDNSRVRKIDAHTGVINTVAGNGKDHAPMERPTASSPSREATQHADGGQIDVPHAEGLTAAEQLPPATKASVSPFVGHYHHGTVDSIEELYILPNHTFCYAVTAGSLDLVAPGRWTAAADGIVLDEVKPASNELLVAWESTLDPNEVGKLLFTVDGRSVGAQGSFILGTSESEELPVNFRPLFADEANEFSASYRETRPIGQTKIFVVAYRLHLEVTRKESSRYKILEYRVPNLKPGAGAHIRIAFNEQAAAPAIHKEAKMKGGMLYLDDSPESWDEPGPISARAASACGARLEALQTGKKYHLASGLQQLEPMRIMEQDVHLPASAKPLFTTPDDKK